MIVTALSYHRRNHSVNAIRTSIIGSFRYDAQWEAASQQGCQHGFYSPCSLYIQKCNYLQESRACATRKVLSPVSPFYPKYCSKLQNEVKAVSELQGAPMPLSNPSTSDGLHVLKLSVMRPFTKGRHAQLDHRMLRQDIASQKPTP
eukprot:2009285-Pleurochrysis_carterae.AAC.5